MALIGANVPFLVSILMGIITVEQYYLLRPMIKTYRLTEAKEIVTLSLPFLIILIGALISGIIDLPLIFIPQPAATDFLVMSSLTRTTFEMIAFSLLMLIPFRDKKRRRYLSLFLPLVALGINTMAIVIFSIYLIVNVQRILSTGGSNFTSVILSIGILLLITSKMVLIYPTGMLSIYAKELISSIMELFGLSNFLILKEGLTAYVKGK